MPSSFDNQLGNSCMLRQHWLHERRVHFLNQNEGIKMMELIQTVALRAPLVIACAVFAMAAMFKLGKEKGAGLIAVGAAGLCLTVIINPFFSYLVMPRIVRDMDPQNISFAFVIFGGISNLFWTAAIALVATGTFLRSPNVEGKGNRKRGFDRAVE